MQKIVLWIGVCRPYSFFASICPILMGLIALDSIPRPWVAVLTLLCGLMLQVLSNLINDYYDYKRGADRADREGPSRPLAEGVVTESQMRKACFIVLALCIVLGAVLVAVGGWEILAVGLLSIFFAWIYTATPYSLAYLGIADIVCFLFYGPVAAAGTAWLQTGTLSWPAVFLGCVSGCASVCVLATNNIRDIDGDRAVGKRTFPVRFGIPAAKAGIAVLIAGALAFMLAATNDYAFSKLAFVPFAFSIFVFIKLLSAQGSQYNRWLFSFCILNALYVVTALVVKML